MELKENERIDTVNDGLRLITNIGHLAFGTDALLLAGYLGKGERAAELGAGNGVVSLLAAARGKFAHIDGVELQKEALDLFERNIALNGLSDRVSALGCDLRELPGELAGRYDCVFSNPPYMKTGAGKSCASDERQAARHETAGGIFDFCAAASTLLRYGGEAVFVYRPDRLCDLMNAMRQNGIEPKRMTSVCANALHAPSMVLVCGKKGGAPGLFVSPAFFISELSGGKTDDYQRLMKEGWFDERYRNP